MLWPLSTKPSFPSASIAFRLVGMVCVMWAAVSQAQTPGADYVLVRRVVDSRYFAAGNTETAPRTPTPGAVVDWDKVNRRVALSFEEALRSSVSREVVVPEKDTVPALVLREYGFGQKDTKSAYAAIERRILQANGLAKPEDLKANTRLKIPTLPPMAPKEPSDFNIQNRIPKSSVYADLPSVASGRTFDSSTLSYRVPPQLRFALRKGSPLVVQYLWLPRDAVAKERSLLEHDGEALEVHAEFVTARMDSSDAQASTGSFPSAQEQEFLKSRLSEKPLQSPVLIVLDDGWPSDQAYRDSLQFLSEGLKAIEAKYKYAVGKNVSALAASPRATTFPKEKFHARSIADALAALTSLEPTSAWSTQRVKVVYLPLTTAQLNASSVLEDIVTLRLLDDFMGPARGDPPPPEEVSRQRALARQIVARVPKDIGVVDLTTDKAVIESVLWFADLYAHASGQPYVVNFSWTTAKLQNRYTNVPLQYGLLVSAAGNSSAAECSKCRPHLALTDDCRCADNVVAAERWFAVRAVDGQDVVTVMNVARDGSLQCKSSVVGYKAGIDPLAVALDGRISSQTCGTSFAAPRVAWLVAARLAYVDPAALDADGAYRGHQLHNLVKRGRIGGLTKGDQFNMDVQKLFSPLPKE